MILSVNYEETRALRSGAENLLSGDSGGPCAVLAPPEDRVRVEELMGRLHGDLSLQTLEEIYTVERAVEAILDCLRAEMETAVVTAHPAGEGAVAAYFEFAHVLSVAYRIHNMADEMRALIELVTGEPATADAVRGFHFPD